MIYTTIRAKIASAYINPKSNYVEIAMEIFYFKTDFEEEINLETSNVFACISKMKEGDFSDGISQDLDKI